ncbi:MAG: hypothetical protein CM1200mP16_07800 [Nitrospina sp.]|nr:MAG: hypothetical protein CM1200mP16_07800 [Nitrospina sp.]
MISVRSGSLDHRKTFLPVLSLLRWPLPHYYKRKFCQQTSDVRVLPIEIGVQYGINSKHGEAFSLAFELQKQQRMAMAKIVDCQTAHKVQVLIPFLSHTFVPFPGLGQWESAVCLGHMLFC